MQTNLSLAYVIDPRFPGGTSAAIAAELRALDGLARISVHAVSAGLFTGTAVAPALAETLDDLQLPLIWDAPAVAADIVILHNPSFLKFQPRLATRITARDLVVVTHENFLRPGGAEAFDAGACLGRIDRAALALRKWIAPISAHNRRTVEDWRALRPARQRGWQLLPSDWFNICAFALLPPTAAPADRRGRLSRPGFEKFPPLAAMDLCFPPTAQANVILGADHLTGMAEQRPHWQLYPFGALPVARFFAMIDFMVYFTAPGWRESFGRVLAEAMAAGKVVLSDPDTAAPFGRGVLPCRPDEVEARIARLIATPGAFGTQVAAGQSALAAFSAERFRDGFATFADECRGTPA